MSWEKEKVRGGEILTEAFSNLALLFTFNLGTYIRHRQKKRRICFILISSLFRQDET